MLSLVLAVKIKPLVDSSQKDDFNLKVLIC